jgi:transketolase
VALLLTRQAVPNLAPNPDALRGGYVLADADGRPDLLLLATGSEVSLAVEARQKLAAKGVQARVVSLPSWEIFSSQPADYQEKVLPRAVTARLAVEAGCPMGWHRFVGLDGEVIAIDGRFGASAPAKVVLERLGLSVDNVVARAEALVARHRAARS